MLQNDRVEQTVGAVRGDHSVGNRAVKIDAVALVEGLRMLTDLYFQRSLDDKVTFLPVVRGQFDVRMERSVGILVLDIQRIRDTVLESGRHIVIDHFVRLLDLLTVSGARQRVGAEFRAAPLDQVRHVDAERQCATVEKREVQIASALLTEQILLFRNARILRHLCGSESGNLTKFVDPARHLADLVIQSCNLLTHLFLRFAGINKKARPKV